MFKTKKVRPAPVPAAEAYSSIDVAKVANVSLRQLQWWDERHVVSPEHAGHKRVYTSAQVVEITVIAELRRKGFSLQKIRRVLRYLQREMGRRLSDVLSNDSALHLLTDGKTIYLEDKQDRIIDVLKGAKQPMFLVCVSDQVRRLQATPKKPARREAASSIRRARAI
jgi:DNA-binding transcriptional MerR regulator